MLNAVLTTAEVLEILVMTENLVNLTLKQMVKDENDSPHLQVALPNLSHLAIHVLNNPFPGLALLNCIEIPGSCILRFSAQSMHPRDIVSTPNLLSALLSAISPSAQRLLACHAPHKIRLRYSDTHFELRASSRSSQPVFEIKMGLANYEKFPPYALASFLGIFTIPSFSEVAEFEFVLMGVRHPVPEFTEFTLCLPAVKVIDTDKLSVRHLTRAQEALKAHPVPAVIFPCLETLIVTLGLLLPRHSDFDSDPVSEFFMTRIAHGHPISTIDLTPVMKNRLPDDMAFLKEATGLKLRWRESKNGEIFEYICGMGSMSQNLLSS